MDAGAGYCYSSTDTRRIGGQYVDEIQFEADAAHTGEDGSLSDIVDSGGIAGFAGREFMVYEYYQYIET